MTEEAHRRWDILLKVVVLLGSVWAAWTYFDKKETEFRKPFWEAQLRLYFEATDTASKVANLPEGKQRDEAVDRFWQLFYGPLRVVEDNDNVSKAMVGFATCVRQKCGQTELQNLSLRLADACTRSLGETWDQKFRHYKALAEERNK